MIQHQHNFALTGSVVKRRVFVVKDANWVNLANKILISLIIG